MDIDWSGEQAVINALLKQTWFQNAKNQIWQGEFAKNQKLSISDLDIALTYLFDQEQIGLALGKTIMLVCDLKALSHYVVQHQRMPTYEKFSKYVGIRWVR